MTGSWMDRIFFKDLRSGQEEQLWQEPPLADKAHLQYFYYPHSILMNYVSDDMKNFIPRTDSRWRQDLRLFENDKIDESDVEKVKIEERQRRQRKLREEG